MRVQPVASAGSPTASCTVRRSLAISTSPPVFAWRTGTTQPEPLAVTFGKFKGSGGSRSHWPAPVTPNVARQTMPSTLLIAAFDSNLATNTLAGLPGFTERLLAPGLLPSPCWPSDSGCGSACHVSPPLAECHTCDPMAYTWRTAPCAGATATYQTAWFGI